jgi:hypothetical protein
MFPGSSSILGRSDETRHSPESYAKLRVTAASAAALSEGRAAFGDLLRRRPKLFAELHKRAVEGCLAGTLNSWMMRKSFRFVSIALNRKVVSGPCGFRRHRSDLIRQGCRQKSNGLLAAANYHSRRVASSGSAGDDFDMLPRNAERPGPALH